MSIKHHFVRLAEKITGRKCSRCLHNVGGTCTHPHPDAFDLCWQTMYRPGFTPRKTPAPGEMTEEELRQLRDTVASLTEACDKAINDELTDEDMYQLEKIVDSLKVASETARDAGLLENTEPRPIWEDKTESGLLEDE